MGRTHMKFNVFLTLMSLLAVRSESCKWEGAIVSLGECFLIINDYLTYFEAKNSCQVVGGVLAKLKNETQLLETTQNITDDGSVWVGANDNDTVGTWVWEEGDAVATDLWTPGQPVNAPDKRCAYVHVTTSSPSSLFDANCDSVHAVLCMEKELTTTSTTVTTVTTATDAIITPTSAETVTMKSDANVINFNHQLLLNLFAFIYLVI